MSNRYNEDDWLDSDEPKFVKIPKRKKLQELDTNRNRDLNLKLRRKAKEKQKDNNV